MIKERQDPGSVQHSHSTGFYFLLFLPREEPRPSGAPPELCTFALRGCALRAWPPARRRSSLLWRWFATGSPCDEVLSINQNAYPLRLPQRRDCPQCNSVEPPVWGGLSLPSKKAYCTREGRFFPKHRGYMTWGEIRVRDDCRRA